MVSRRTTAALGLRLLLAPRRLPIWEREDLIADEATPYGHDADLSASSFPHSPPGWARTRNGSCRATRIRFTICGRSAGCP